MRVKWLLVLVAALGVAGLAASCSDEDADNDSEATTTEVAATPTEDADHDDGDDHDAAVDSIGFEMSADTVLHHWEALTAIKAEDVEDVRHHVEHILDAVAADETHAGAMRDVLAALDANDFEEAEHGIEGMLVGRAEPGLTAEALHLQMALAAVLADEEADARHHIDHFMGLGDDDADAQQILTFLDDGDHEEAAEHLEAMIAAHGGEVSHDDDAMEHEAALEADREITVVATEFSYESDVIRAKVGERVRLIVDNRGAVLHDITAEEFHGEVETVGVMESHDSTASGDHMDAGTFHAAATAGGTAELVFEADEAGEYTLFCTVPGHRELGMTATLVIEE